MHVTHLALPFSGGFRGARGAVAPPHLLTQDIQKDGCVVIKTH